MPVDKNLPAWPGASQCYSKAYRVLERMAVRTKARSEDMERLIKALDSGDEEQIKGLLLMTHVYF